jgi:hypothetical protein
MTPEQENFDALRRLLALKRHEQPPPGYFNSFSRQVIARIRAGDFKEEPSFFERFFGQAAWLHRAWSDLESKPALAGAFGIMVCGLLVFGMVYSEHSDSHNLAITPLVNAEPAPAQLASQAEPLGSDLRAGSGLRLVTSESPVAGFAAPAQNSLFQDFKDIQRPILQPVSLGVGGN